MLLCMNKEDLIYAFAKAADYSDTPENEVLLIDAAHSEFPNLKGLKVSWPKQGGSGDVLFLGKHYVLKAPTAAEDSEEEIIEALEFFEEECETQQKLSHISLVPDVLHISDEFNFCIMERKHGVTLKSTHGKRTKEQDERIAATLAEFCRDVAKALPISEYPDKYPIDSYIKSGIINLKDDVNADEVEKLLGKARQSKYINIINKVDALYKGSTPVIMHGDLCDENVIVSLNDFGKVTGIIDYELMSKYTLPENNLSLKGLGGNIRPLLIDAHFQQRTNSEYKISDLLITFEKISNAINYPDHTTEANIKENDTLIAKCKI